MAHLGNSLAIVTTALSLWPVLGCSALVETDPDLLGDSLAVDMNRSDGGVDTDGFIPPADTGTRDEGTELPDSQIDDLGSDPSMCPAPPRCEGNVSIICQGADAVRTNCDEECSAETGTCVAPFIPSNVDASEFDPNAPSLDIQQNTVFDTTRCQSAANTASVVTMNDGGEACVLRARDVRVREDTVLHILGNRPGILLVTGNVTIEGIVNASAQLTIPGPGGFGGGQPIEGRANGSGPGGGGAGEVESLEFEDGGGGGGGACGMGGMGGRGGDPPSNAAGGTGGRATSPGDLQPLVGGSGGGRGRGSIGDGIRNAGLGGAGGGALQISARGRIDIDGGVLIAAGGGGEGGKGDGGFRANWGSGGGGGSGGSILLEAAELTSTGLIAVPGGGGGGGSDIGANGQDGAGLLEGAAAPSGGDGGGSLGAPGGDGAGTDTMEGDAGEDVRLRFGNGGGGGGGGGCIVFRTEAAGSLGQINPRAAVLVLGLLP